LSRIAIVVNRDRGRSVVISILRWRVRREYLRKRVWRHVPLP
jgi:hypothetical protein